MRAAQPPAELTTPSELAIEAETAQTLKRIGSFPREIGWMMVYMGVLGVIVPGIPGAPFFLAAAAVLTPGGPQRMARWVGPKPGPITRFSLKTVVRYVDDLDRRYPTVAKTGAR